MLKDYHPDTLQLYNMNMDLRACLAQLADPATRILRRVGPSTLSCGLSTNPVCPDRVLVVVQTQLTSSPVAWSVMPNSSKCVHQCPLMCRVMHISWLRLHACHMLVHLRAERARGWTSAWQMPATDSLQCPGCRAWETGGHSAGKRLRVLQAGCGDHAGAGPACQRVLRRDQAGR